MVTEKKRKMINKYIDPFEEVKCPKCGGLTNGYDRFRNRGVCKKCKSSQISKVVLVFAIIGFILFIVLGGVEYNFALEKCDKLNSQESNYDFTNTVETNAQYNSDCYYLRYHPLAKILYYIGFGIFGIIIFSGIGFLVMMLPLILRGS